MAANVMEIYGKYVFNAHVMKERLPSATYKSLKATLEKGQPLDIEVANVVASVMKRWAMEMGATHYTHWFQPLTGITSEKHDGFVSPMKDGTAIMEFSGKELVKGEPDASSFPNGGLRATCEARGYTAWDPTSYAFVKDGVLCIPTAFCSYNGEALDKKTPLLRSMSALSTQACRILKLFGKEVEHVSTTVGAEQEYFLVRKEDYETRQDLILTGRTLFGAMPAKGQELEEHYFGTLRPIVSEYMEDLDNQLWELGIPAKTKHNEVAPCQHELAPIFDTTNIAVDHNLLTMEMMKKVAEKHGLVCLLAEKPFEGVNGSGKHNNWSMTANGVNLLDPGDTPMENLQFLIFLAAVIKAVDQYQDLLRAAVASPGNDHRLGANEAPPAIISMFVGDDLAAVLDAISNDAEYADPGRQRIDLGVDVLPKFKKDNTDRNRTSPFAFTGNKFEFRMPGSSMNLADANTVHAAPAMTSEKNIALFEEMGVLSRVEVMSRYEVIIEHYAKVLHIEAMTMLEMANKQLIPAATAYMSDVASAAAAKMAVSEKLSCKAENKVLEKLSAATDAMSDAVDALDAAVESAESETDSLEKAKAYRDKVLPAMADLRTNADAAEVVCGEDYWPLPGYSKMLYYV